MTDVLCLDDTPTAEEFAARQERETVAQDAAGVTVRLATITCRCGWERAVLEMYRCLYCGEWLCEVCAEAHFGKTREQYRAERLAKTQAERHNGRIQGQAVGGGTPPEDCPLE